MSWHDFYARRDIMDAVLKRARGNPAATLPFEEIDRAKELFGSCEQLLLALYYRWTQLLGGYLRAELVGPEDSDNSPRDESDNADRATAAWQRAHRKHPTLRAVLDAGIEAYPAVLRPAFEREQRMLAISAGLADPYEPVAEITRVGASFLTLIQHSGEVPARHSGPVGQLMRLLTPAG